MKKIFKKCCPLIAAVLLLSGCGGGEPDPGTSLRILCRNDEFKLAFESLFGDKAVYMGERVDDVYRNCTEYIYGGECLPEGVEQIGIIVDMDSYYDPENYLNEKLVKNDDPVDIFLTEPDYMYSHINSDITLPLSETGFKDKYTKDMFPYTVSLGTAEDGTLKAVSWQAEPGVFFYRRDIALEVFGDDSPEAVSKLVSEDAEAAAEKLSEAGYFLLGSPQDAVRMYAQNRTERWLTDGKVTVDPIMKQWADDMCGIDEKGGFAYYPQWSDGWMNGLSSEQGDVFGYCLPVWAAAILDMWQDGSCCWGVCVPPRPYYWGGSFLCVSSNTDNPRASGEFLRELFKKGDMKGYAKDNINFGNSVKAMKKAAKSDDFYSEFFAQNPYEVYLEAAKDITGNTVENDEIYESQFSVYMEDYIHGYSDYETCLNSFLSYAEYIGNDSE